MRQPTKGGRLETLDGLRGLAATGVVALHVWMFDWGGEGRPPKEAVDYFFGELRLGVALFFVLSGFLLYRPFVAAAFDGRRPALGRYALRRVARIVPAYYLVLAGTLLIIWHAGQSTLAADISRIPAFLGFAQNQVHEARHFNPPLWTIGVEVSFYVALPLLALLAVRLGPGLRRQVALVGGVIGIGLVATLLATLNDYPAEVTRSLPTHLPEFGAGMMAAVFAGRVSFTRAKAIAVASAGTALVVADGVWHSQQLGDPVTRGAIADAPAAAGFALVVIALVATPDFGRWLASAPLRMLGTLSFGIYLWHYPAIRFFRAEQWWPMDGLAKFGLVFGFAATAAAVSWYCVERPVLRWSARVIEKRRERTAAPAKRRAVPAPARA